MIQFKDEEVAKKVEVVILDNISKDNTEKIVDEFAQKYSNIKYHKDTKDRNIAGGQIKVGGLGTGEYIWFFSDDDKFTIDAFKTLIRALENKDYGAIFCNTSSFSANKSENIISENNFKIQQDLILKTKKDLFNFVGKHFYCYNFFFTFMSNYIVKRDVFRQGLEVIKKYNSSLDLFPFHIPIYYNNLDFSFLVIAKPVVRYREGNVSWGPSDKLKHMIFSNKIVNNHLKNILISNNRFLSAELIARTIITRLRVKFNIYLLFLKNKFKN